MKIKILQSAESEIGDAMDYYNKQYPGLGYEFANEIKKSLYTIKAFPEAWSLFQDKIRKCYVSRFPYAILYEVKNEIIIVFAVMHLKLNPKRWEIRIKKYK